jgi:hypothetical protein
VNYLYKCRIVIVNGEIGVDMEQDDWNIKATNVLKSELAREGIGYEELIKRLKEIGIEESYKGIANKINRGAYTFAFFMQCMKALNRTKVSLD